MRPIALDSFSRIKETKNSLFIESFTFDNVVARFFGGFEYGQYYRICSKLFDLTLVAFMQD
jgi:hypothetical protein